MGLGSLLRLLACLAAAVFLLWCFSMRCRGRRQILRFARYRYAHRGLHDIAAGIPENSLAALQSAAEQGFAAELDVRLTRDGRLAVVHDSSLQRLCGVDAAVEDLTAAELSQLRLLGTGHTIPFLEDVLPLFEGRQPLLIELKARRNSARLARCFCAAMKQSAVSFCVESFDPRTLYLIRQRRPDYLRGQLSKNFLRDHSLHAIPGFLLKNLCFNWLSRPDFIAYRYEDRHTWSLRLCRRLCRVPVFYWTVTGPEALHSAEGEGAAPIFEGFLPGSTTQGQDGPG